MTSSRFRLPFFGPANRLTGSGRGCVILDEFWGRTFAKVLGMRRATPNQPWLLCGSPPPAVSATSVGPSLPAAGVFGLMAIVLSSVLAVRAGSARAANDTWDGSESGAWSTAGNWVGNQVPGNTTSGATDSTDVATFSNDVNTTISIDAGRTLGGLVFANDAGPFTFSGGTLFVSSAGSDFAISGTSNVASQTFTVDIAGTQLQRNIVFAKATGVPLGAMYNLLGEIRAGGSGVAGGSINFNAHAIAMVRGEITDPHVDTGATGLNQDFNAGMVWLHNSNTFTGAVLAARGMWIFDSVTPIGGAASSLGRPANSTTGLITAGSTGAADEVGLYYAGLDPAGHSTDRSIRLSSQANITLTAAGTGPLAWSGTVNAVASSGTVAITTNAFVLAGPSAAENVFGGTLEDTGGDGTNPAGLTMSLRKRGEGTWNLTGANTYTGATEIRSGLLRLDFANSGAVNSNIVSASSGLQVGGGGLAIRGAAGETNSQTFASTAFREGYMAISLAPGAGGGTASLSLGGLSRAVVGSGTNPGGSADFTLNGGTISTSTSTTTNGVLTLGGVAFASVGKTDWATVSSGTIGAVASYQTTTNPADWGASDNVSLAANPSANLTTRTVNTLRWNGTSALAIDSGNTLSIGAGGILVTGTGTGSISGGTLRGSTSATAADRDLVILQHNTATPFTISSVIANSAGGATALTKGGDGTLELSGVNTFSGGITIGGGVLKVSSASAMGSSGVKFAGGVLGLAAGDIAATVSTGAANRFSWQGSGGFAAYGSDRTVTFSSNLALESATTTNSMRSGDLLLGAADSDAKITLATAPANNVNITSRSSTSYMATIRVFNGTAPVDADITAPIIVSANGKGGIQKMGSGVLQLSGQNTFNGPTIIGEGGLLVTGTNFNSMVTEVRSDAWLGGTGTITSLELQPGGRVAPGLLDTIGTLATTASAGNGYFLWNGETTSLPQLDFQLSSLDNTSDRLNLGSNPFLRGSGSVFRFDFQGSTATVGETYTLVTFGSTDFADASPFSYTNLDPGQTGTFALTGSALTFLVVPEPGNIALAAVALAVGLGVALRRGRRQAAASSAGSGSRSEWGRAPS